MSIILFDEIKNLSAAIVVDLFWDRFLGHFILVELILFVRVLVNLMMLWVHQIVLDILCSSLPYFFWDTSDLVLKYSFAEGIVQRILKGVVSKLTFCLLGDVVIIFRRPFLMWFLLHLDILNLLLLFFFHISPIVDHFNGLLNLLTSIVGLVPSIVRIDKFFTWRLDNWWCLSLLI